MALNGRIASGDMDLGAPISPSVRGYELLEEIRAGAFGAVHKACQPAIDRQEHPHIVPLDD